MTPGNTSPTRTNIGESLSRWRAPLNTTLPKQVREQIAAELRVNERTVKQLLKPSCSWSPAKRLVAICKALIASGNREKAEALCEPLFALFSSAPAELPTDTLLVEEADLDAELLKARERFALDRCYDTAKAFMRIASKHESAERRLCRAVAETWESA